MATDTIFYTIDSDVETKFFITPTENNVSCVIEQNGVFKITYQQMYELGILLAAIALNADNYSIDQSGAGQLLDGYGIPIPDVLKAATED